MGGYKNPRDSYRLIRTMRCKSSEILARKNLSRNSSFVQILEEDTHLNYPVESFQCRRRRSSREDGMKRHFCKILLRKFQASRLAACQYETLSWRLLTQGILSCNHVQPRTSGVYILEFCMVFIATRFLCQASLYKYAHSRRSV